MVTWDEIVFLLSGSHKNFETIEKNITGIPSKIKTGDLLMREINAAGLYHVGVYCGKLVIEFNAPENSKFSHRITSFLSNSQSGTVNKKSVKSFIAKKAYCVVRLRVAIPENFSESVEDAMDYNGIYHPLTNNCLHFALRLLGLKPGPIPQSLPRQRGTIFSEMLSLLWSGDHNDFITVLESEDGISESDESKLAEGDLILRPMDGKGPFYHAGVYCGESEVIDIVGKPDTSQGKMGGFSCCLSSFSNMNGKVGKVGVKIFVQNKKCRVLRLRCGIAEGFRERVRKAMNDTLKYRATDYNCLHFALDLLGGKHLLDKETPSSFDWSVSQCQTLSEQTEHVDKVSVKKIISGQKYFVLASDGPPQDLQEKINIAVFHCLHFSLSLLGAHQGHYQEASQWMKMREANPRRFNPFVPKFF